MTPRQAWFTNQGLMHNHIRQFTHSQSSDTRSEAGPPKKLAGCHENTYSDSNIQSCKWRSAESANIVQGMPRESITSQHRGASIDSRPRSLHSAIRPPPHSFGGGFSQDLRARDWDCRACQVITKNGVRLTKAWVLVPIYNDVSACESVYVSASYQEHWGLKLLCVDLYLKQYEHCFSLL